MKSHAPPSAFLFRHLHAFMASLPKGANVTFVNGDLRRESIILPSPFGVPRRAASGLVAPLSKKECDELNQVLDRALIEIGTMGKHAVHQVLSELAYEASLHASKRPSFKTASSLYHEDLSALFELLACHPAQAARDVRRELRIGESDLKIVLKQDFDGEVTWSIVREKYSLPMSRLMADQGFFGTLHSGRFHPAKALPFVPYVGDEGASEPLLQYWRRTLAIFVTMVSAFRIVPEMEITVITGDPKAARTAFSWTNGLDEKWKCEATVDNMPELAAIETALETHFSRLPEPFAPLQPVIHTLGRSVVVACGAEESAEIIHIACADARELRLRKNPAPGGYRASILVSGMEQVFADDVDIDGLRALLSEVRFNWRTPGWIAGAVANLVDEKGCEAPELAKFQSHDLRMMPWLLFDAEVGGEWIFSQLQTLSKRWEIVARGLEH